MSQLLFLWDLKLLGHIQNICVYKKLYTGKLIDPRGDSTTWDRVSWSLSPETFCYEIGKGRAQWPLSLFNAASVEPVAEIQGDVNRLKALRYLPMQGIETSLFIHVTHANTQRTSHGTTSWKCLYKEKHGGWGLGKQVLVTTGNLRKIFWTLRA